MSTGTPIMTPGTTGTSSTNGTGADGSGGPSDDGPATSVSSAQETKAETSGASTPAAPAQPDLLAWEMEEGTTPVSRERLQTCLESATLWAEALPMWATRQQRIADAFAILAGIFAVIGTAAVWPAVSSDWEGAQKLLVSLVGMAAAICAVFPRVKNYGESAAQAREVGGLYGPLVGALLDLTADATPDQVQAHSAVRQFSRVKAKKDVIRGLPKRQDLDIAKMRDDDRVTRERTKLSPAPAGRTPSVAPGTARS